MMWNDFPASGFMDQMGASTVGFVLLMILVASAVSLVVTGVMMTRHSTRSDPAARPPGAQELLDQRFATGEIDEDEYWRRSAVLEQRAGPTSIS